MFRLMDTFDIRTLRGKLAFDRKPIAQKIAQNCRKAGIIEIITNLAFALNGISLTQLAVYSQFFRLFIF